MGKKALAKVDPAPQPVGFSGAEYNHVARQARLVGIQLLHLDMDGSPEHYSRADELKLKFNRELLSCRFDEESRSAAAIFRYTLIAKAGRSKAFGCAAEYAVLYKMPEDGTEAASIGFCRHVGSFAAYPYFRAVAAQMAWNAGLELPPLPSIAAMPIVPKNSAAATDKGAKE